MVGAFVTGFPAAGDFSGSTTLGLVSMPCVGALIRGVSTIVLGTIDVVTDNVSVTAAFSVAGEVATGVGVLDTVAGAPALLGEASGIVGEAVFATATAGQR